MLVITIVQDYVFAAMRRAKGAKTEDGVYVLTVLDFPSIVACASDVPGCFKELYRLLEMWVIRSLEHGYDLPPMKTEEGMIDLNTEANRSLARYQSGRRTANTSIGQTFLNGPDELEAYFSDLDRTL